MIRLTAAADAMRAARAARRSDKGFTLIEVLVAFILIAIMSTAALGFSIQANNSSSYVQHRQVAVTVAGQAMDLVSATDPSQLVAKRCQTDVAASFAANSAVIGVSTMYQAWGTTTCGLSETVPIPSTATLAGTTYTTTTVIGVCYRPRLSANGTDCGVVTGYASPPPDAQAAALDVIDEYRVVVVVRWSADRAICPSGCVYQTSTLVDANPDLTWSSS